MKRAFTILLLCALCVGAFYGTYAFMKSPYWSLYQIGKGIHDRNAALFLNYVDLANILRGQQDMLVKEFVPGGKTSEAGKVAGQVLGALMDPIITLARRETIKAVADPDRDNLPSSWTLVAAADVTIKPDYALAVFTDPDKGEKWHLGMKRHPKEGHWQVVEVDPEDVKRLIKRYVKP